mgnify:CR=1 FL=1
MWSKLEVFIVFWMCLCFSCIVFMLLQSGYERLCCLCCIQPRDHNYGTTCVCRVPKHLREEKVIECVHCGCKGCASGDWLIKASCLLEFWSKQLKHVILSNNHGFIFMLRRLHLKILINGYGFWNSIGPCVILLLRVQDMLCHMLSYDVHESFMCQMYVYIEWFNWGYKSFKVIYGVA